MAKYNPNTSPEIATPYVFRGKPISLSKMNADMDEANLSVNPTPPPELPEVIIPPVPAPPSESELQDEADEQAERAAEDAAEAQMRAAEAAERIIARHEKADMNDELFGVNDEDVMGSPSGGDDDDLSDITDVDDEDIGADIVDEVVGDDDDFSDLFEVDEEDIMGSPPEEPAPQRPRGRVRRFNPPTNTTLGGIVL